MNFVEAALHILEEMGKPIHVDELCKLAVEQDLLAKPGKNPLRSMKSRLTLEYKKGRSSRVSKVEDNIWEFKGKGKKSPKKKAEKTDKETASKERVQKSESKAEARAPKKSRGSKKRREASSEIEEASSQENTDSVEAKSNESAVDESVSPESQTESLSARNEYSDALTKDEDRKFLPEIKQDRNKGRKKRRERPKRGGQKEKVVSTDWQASKPRRERPSLDQLDINVDGSPFWVKKIAEELALSSDGSTVPLRQMVRTVLKRESLSVDEQKVWRLVKGILLKDQFDRQSKGERPIVVHETNDLFRLARPCLLYTSPSPRDATLSRMPSSA